MTQRTAPKSRKRVTPDPKAASPSPAVQEAQRLVEWARKMKPFDFSSSEPPDKAAVRLVCVFSTIQTAVERILLKAGCVEDSEGKQLAGWLAMFVYEVHKGSFAEGYSKGFLDCQQVARTQGAGGGPEDKDGRRRLRREYVARQHFVNGLEPKQMAKAVALLDGEPDDIIRLWSPAQQDKYTRRAKQDVKYITEHPFEFGLDAPLKAAFIRT